MRFNKKLAILIRLNYSNIKYYKNYLNKNILVKKIYLIKIKKIKKN